MSKKYITYYPCGCIDYHNGNINWCGFTIGCMTKGISSITPSNELRSKIINKNIKQL